MKIIDSIVYKLPIIGSLMTYYRNRKRRKGKSFVKSQRLPEANPPSPRISKSLIAEQYMRQLWRPFSVHPEDNPDGSPVHIFIIEPATCSITNAYYVPGKTAFYNCQTDEIEQLYPELCRWCYADELRPSRR